jgi:hypothetical protein
MSYLVSQDPPVNLFDAVMADRDEREEHTASLVGKTAVWKIRVYGPAKFAERSGVISFVINNSAFTKEGKRLLLIDMVDTPDEVGGGGMWAVAS